MQERGTFQLVMGQGPQPGQIFEMPRSTVSIGRDPGNQIVLDDAQISRQHARITPQGGLMVLEDLGSTNGTTVNGLRISTAHTLAHGDEIGLGDNVTLIFYGWPASQAGETVAAPRGTYANPPPAVPPGVQRQPLPAAADDVTFASYQPPAEYAQPEVLDHEGYSDYFEEYEEGTDRNWTLIGLGCILIAVIVGLLVALFVYFLAPASIVDPIADFLAGFGVNVP